MKAILSAANFLQDNAPIRGFAMVPRALQETAGDYAVRLYTCIQEAGTAIFNAAEKGAHIFKLCKTTLFSMFKRKGKGRGSERTYAQALAELRENGYLYQIQIPSSSKHGEWEWFYFLLHNPDLTFRGVIRCTSSLDISSVGGKFNEGGKYKLPESIKDSIKAYMKNCSRSGRASSSDSSIDNKPVYNTADLTDEQKNLISTIRKEKNSDIESMRKLFKDRLESSSYASLSVIPKNQTGILDSVKRSLLSASQRDDPLKIDGKYVSIPAWLELMNCNFDGKVVTSIVNSVDSTGLHNIRNFDNYVSAGAYRYILSHKSDLSSRNDNLDNAIKRINIVENRISPYLVDAERELSVKVLRSLYVNVRREKIILRDGSVLTSDDFLYALSDALEIGSVLYVVRSIIDNGGIKNITNFDNYVAEQIYWCITNGISALDADPFAE